MARWLGGLGARGVLGINRRNLEHVFGRNPRKRFRRVDDKIETKRWLARRQIPFPEVIAVVSERGRIRPCLEALAGRDEFVIKPSRGYGGQGVRVVCRSGAPRDRSDDEDLAFHMASILSGMYSLDRLASDVLVEARVRDCTAFQRLHGGTGVSDVRIIVSDGQAVMAMLRLPCSASGGRANLHAGGIGVGIEIDGGKTTSAIHRGRPIERHPDSHIPLAGHAIPAWPEILRMAVPMNELFGMGYLGVDAVVDAARGPLILEVNARPGLTIQLANREGLRDALRRRMSGREWE